MVAFAEELDAWKRAAPRRIIEDIQELKNQLAALQAEVRSLKRAEIVQFAVRKNGGFILIGASRSNYPLLPPGRPPPLARQRGQHSLHLLRRFL